MSRTEQELQYLIESLIDRFRREIESTGALRPLGGGMTRLGKVEFLAHSKPAQSTTSLTAETWIRESALMRARQRQYSSVGLLKLLQPNNPNRLEITVEHESGYAFHCQVDFRIKRPGIAVFGEIRKAETEAEIFVTE